VAPPKEKRYAKAYRFSFGRATHEAHRAPHAAGVADPVRIRRQSRLGACSQAAGERILAAGEMRAACLPLANDVSCANDVTLHTNTLTPRRFSAILKPERRWRYEENNKRDVYGLYKGSL